MSVSSPPDAKRRAIPWGALALGAGISAAIAIVANVFIRAIFLGVFDISDDFEPLASAGPIFPATIVGIGLAALVFALVIRLRARPIRDFQIVALVALVLSALPLIGVWTSDDAVNGPAIIALGLMHVVTAAAVFLVLIPFVRRRLPSPERSSATEDDSHAR